MLLFIDRIDVETFAKLKAATVADLAMVVWLMWGLRVMGVHGMYSNLCNARVTVLDFMGLHLA